MNYKQYPIKFKKYYKYNDINSIIRRVHYAKNSNLVLYPEFKDFYRENDYYIDIFKSSQKVKRKGVYSRF